MIFITSKKEGFRRCGVRHAKATTAYADDRFSPDQLRRLDAEPMLIVERDTDVDLFDDTPMPEKMTVAALRDMLRGIGVDAPANAKKADLVAIVSRHTDEPPGGEG